MSEDLVNLAQRWPERAGAAGDDRSTPEASSAVETTKRHDHRQSVWLVGDLLWCYQCGAWRQNAEGRHPWHKPTGIGGPNPCSTGTRREGTR
jgi:hypothetical protein